MPDVESSTGKIFESEMDVLLSKPEFQQFKLVFDKFHVEEHHDDSDFKKGDIIETDDEDNKLSNKKEQDTKEEDQIAKPSKKAQKKARKIPLAELKANCKNPELVQWFDADAKDPYLTIQLKSQKNFVPVAAHWQLKREYLNGRRATDKQAFVLPKFIRDTGITDMRDTTKEDETSLKQRTREKVQPKMNRLDLDYQRLYDAFFKFQTKPRLFKFGDMYFEGRELDELDVSKYRPGVISKELRHALGIQDNAPVPWIQKYQMFGPPPSYPDLKIPGFNTNIDQETGVIEESIDQSGMGNVVKEHFGELIAYEDEPEEEEEEEEEEESEDENNVEGYREEDEQDEENAPVYVDESEIATEEKSNHTDIPLYNENSDEEDVQLPPQQTTPTTKQKSLYTVLEENKFNSEFLSSGRTYKIPSKRRNSSDSNISSSENKKVKSEELQDKHNQDEEDEEDEEDVDTSKFKF